MLSAFSICSTAAFARIPRQVSVRRSNRALSSFRQRRQMTESPFWNS
jgi:hypothetical protein